ncbi:MAG: glycerophosphoryl diester phosphodiesterase membrane domain-containing protein, partial [Acidobacteriota bacterium]
EAIVERCSRRAESAPRRSISDRLDAVATHPVVGTLLFVGIMAIPAVLNAGLALMVQVVNRALAAPGVSSADEPLQVLAGSLIFVMTFAVFVLVNLVVYSIAVAATTMAVSEVHLGRDTTITRSYKMISGRVLRVVGLSITVMLIFVAGLFVSVMAGAAAGVVLALAQPVVGLAVWVMAVGLGVLATFLFLTRFGVAVPALMLENLPVTESLRRSAALTKGHRLRVILIYILMLLISYVAVFLFQGPFVVLGWALGGVANPPFWTEALGVVFGSAGGALSGPLLLIGLALLYFDLRVRKEAFDLDLLLKQVPPVGGPAA